MDQPITAQEIRSEIVDQPITAQEIRSEIVDQPISAQEIRSKYGSRYSVNVRSTLYSQTSVYL